jgi:hypothetical protein
MFCSSIYVLVVRRIKLKQFYSKTIWRKLAQFITFKVFGLNINKNKFIFRNIKSSNKFNDYKNISDSSITYNQKLNEFYLNLNYEDIKLPNNAENIVKNKKICSIDPGVRTF